MPGRLLRLTPLLAVGWAAHPRLPGYRVVVHLAHRAVIVRSALAEEALPAERTGDVATDCGFSIDLAPLGLERTDLDRLRFGIGETDERIDLPVGWPARAAEILTVEDILAEAHAARPWVAGGTYLDAAAAGLRAETIIDLLYRDYLGRPSDANGLARYAAEIRREVCSYDDIRRIFIASDEYLLRRKHLDRAPGAIFSQGIVMAVAAADRGQHEPAPPTARTVPAGELLRFEGAEFVAELYRRVLLKEADPGGMAHYLHQLHLGVAKATLVRTIAGELEAITAGVRVTFDPGDEGLGRS